MQVVASVKRLLAVGRDIGAEVVLVGRLVVGEAGVAIETVGAVFHREMGDRVVEGHDTFQRLLHTTLEVGPDGLILWLVILKPRAVVVGRKLSQVLQYPFCIHNLTVFACKDTNF